VIPDKKILSFSRDSNLVKNPGDKFNFLRREKN
jgi:hypothetical protein